MNLELDGKFAIVTGASRGIGLATAELLASEGCGVAICARGEHDLERAHESLQKHGPPIFSRACDLQHPGDLALQLDWGVGVELRGKRVMR